MRLISFLVAIAVLFALSDSSVAQDRYPAVQAARPTPGARAAGLRLLTWPGKVAAPQAAAAPAPQPSQPDRAQAAAPALPASIYDPAPPKPIAPAAPAVQALAQAAPAAGYPTARYYSVHRPYGQTPDAAVLGAQFFDGATPDLAAPPPPPPRTVTTASGRVQRVAPDAAD